MTEEKRRERNVQRMRELHPEFRVRIDWILHELEAAGFRPRIQDAWRSITDQLRAYNTGHSKLMYGFHNVTAEDGSPEALACDILDDDNPLHPSRPYVLRLAAIAKRAKCNTGVFWGLDDRQKAMVMDAIVGEDWYADVRVGWDPCHVEPDDLTVDEARRGKRPGAWMPIPEQKADVRPGSMPRPELVRIAHNLMELVKELQKIAEGMGT